MSLIAPFPFLDVLSNEVSGVITVFFIPDMMTYFPEYSTCIRQRRSPSLKATGGLMKSQESLLSLYLQLRGDGILLS